MPVKALICIETDLAFITSFKRSLINQLIESKYEVLQIAPENLGGFDKMLDQCLRELKRFHESRDVAAIYVDLCIGDSVIDKHGISLGMGIRKIFPKIPLFCITNKNKYDNNFDNLSEASLEDFDGVFEKNFLVGPDFSETRLENMLAKAGEKRRKSSVWHLQELSKDEPAPEDRYDLAIVTALFDYEFEQVQELVDFEKESQQKAKSLKSTKVGRLKNSKLKVVIDYQKKMGQVDAAILSANILSVYKPKLVVLTGVCGGREAKGVKRGDIVIPSEIYDYQMGKYENGKVKPYSYREKINEELIGKAREWKGEIMRQIEDSATREKTRIKKTDVHFDAMACGSLVLKSDGYLDYISQKQDEKTVAVEMESYGIARCCNSYPFKDLTMAIIVKASMDGANRNKNDIDKEWAAHISSQFAYYLALKLEESGFFDRL